MTGRGPCLGRRDERGTRDVVGGQAQPALLLGGERGRRRDRGAAVLARGRRAAPCPVGGQEVGTDRRHGAGRMVARWSTRIRVRRASGPGT